jgi:hypothetical protein
MAENETSSPSHGGCLCGAVRYTVRGPLRDAIACHCSQCRRSTGHHFVATSARLADFSMQDESALRWYRASPQARRGFCATCGSSLFWQRDDAPVIGILVGSLDPPTGVKLAAHIFVVDKGDYYDIADGLPQHDGHDHGIPYPGD